MSLGILVHGANHLILSGPLPSPRCARRLAAEFALALVPLGRGPRREFLGWRIRTREFRQNLEWAVQLGAEESPSPAVAVLLDELARRGVTVRRDSEPWEGASCD